ncbi:transferrin-binding protein-like solute binding protein [Nitratireductor sp. XY-223]|uniref:transferrin-binding protein-like solute binding protein n=1 Tax=Nitratireductor sp. XY-223 TaxID=2561926 RepID=UPI0010AA5172|nr:transferrin-binding protein-like solute binding protein [Nitratireductor sp. XY-223]
MTKQSQRVAVAGRPRRLALMCCASVLTLGLAACNTTGGGGAGGGTGNGGAAPTSELGKAQAAAKAAMEAAKTQSDAADTEADKAEAAQMNIALLQTGDPMAKTHAEAARAAARAAMTAYNTAKAESAKAAAATTDTAAVEARIAAQAALKTAQAQQKIAMDKAAEAVKAAGMEVKVSYDDDGKPTYRVGEVTIVAGAEKMVKKVNDEVERTTGKIGPFTIARRSARTASPYKEKSGNTPEVMAQPAVERRSLTIGSITDSADDKMRLVLVDKYETSEAAKKDVMVSVFRRNDNPSENSNHIYIRATPENEDAPYGTFDQGDKKYVVKRATGVFYEVTGPDATPTGKTGSGSLDKFTIGYDKDPQNTNDENGIYYHDDDEGNRTWYKRVGVTTDGNADPSGSGNDGVRYQYIKTPVHNVRFPTAKSFEHLNYGTWAGLKEDGNTLADLGTGFVSKLPDGTVTPTNDMPNFGQATYEGGWTGNVRAAAADGNGAITNQKEVMTTIAKFGENTLTTTLNTLATLKGDIDGNSFSGTGVSGVGTKGGLTGGDGYTGSFSGSFFGPKAEEIGGVFDITSEGRKAGEARGAFGGGMTASE